MKIYALVYKYKIKDKDSTSRMFQLNHVIKDSLEDAMEEVESDIKGQKGYVEYSCEMELKNVMSLDRVLDKVKVSLPELVKNAKQREKLTKVAEALQ